MSERDPYRRVIVSIAAGATEVGGLAAAADIARLFGAELAGLYIEDETVLNVSGLPFAFEIAAAGVARPLRRIEVEQAYRSAAGVYRRQFESFAGREKLSFSFNTLRGEIAFSIEQSSTARDIIAFVESDSPLERACLSSAILFAAAMRSRGALLYVPRAHAEWREGVVAYLSGTADRQVIEAAGRIALARGLPLTLVGRGPQQPWQEALEDIFKVHGEEVPQVDFRSLDRDGLETLLTRFADLDDRLLVMARDSALQSAPQELRNLIRRRRAPLLLIEVADRAA